MSLKFRVALLLQTPGMAHVIAEEVLLRKLEVAIATPDFLAGEAEKLQDWKITVQAAYAEAETKAGEELGERAQWPERMLSRMVAYRRLYAVRFGSETYRKIPELGGESNIPVKLPCGTVLKLGLVASARYRHDAKMWEEYRTWRDAQGAVDAAERLIDPRTQVTTRAEWEKARTLSQEVKPFRAWNATSHLPAILRSQIFDMENLPDGVHFRPGVMRAFAAGVGAYVIDHLYAVGLSAFVTDPGLEYLAAHKEEVDALAGSHELVPSLLGRRFPVPSVAA